MRKLLLVLFLIALPLRADVNAQIDAFAKKAMREIGTTPGMAIVVVKDDRVVYRGDFGVRDVEMKLPVTAGTRFLLASSTKAFTAMVAAILASEGKIDLDAPVDALWPEFPKRLSLRDFLAMRSGLGNDTLNFRVSLPANIENDDELLRILATYSKEQPRTFRYSNMSYLLAARVMEKATGKRWSELVRERILVPLQMTSTATSLHGDVPVAHLYRSTSENVFVPTAANQFLQTVLKNDDSVAAPAGGMITTTSDIAKWLIAMMNDGAHVLPSRAVRMVQSEQTTNKTRFRYFDRFAWGLGQDLADYEGDLLVHRFGGINGAYSHVSFMPNRRIAVAVFANGGGAVADAVAAYAYDVMLGKKDIEPKWSAELAKAAAAAEAARDERRKSDAKLSEHHDAAHPLDAYAGTYHYDRLGTLVLRVANGHLIAQLGAAETEFVPAGGDQFLADWLDEGDLAPINIVFDDSGRATRVDWGGRVFERVR